MTPPPPPPPAPPPAPPHTPLDNNDPASPDTPSSYPLGLDPATPSTAADSEQGDPVAQATQAAAEIMQRLEALEKDKQELQEKLLRMTADYQNYARRAQQNVVEARQQQTMQIARQMLNVLDHFDRALEVDPAKVTADSLLQGVRIVRDELTKSLEQFDVKRLEVAIGEPFDPARHEAMLRQPSADMPENHVTMILQVGYGLGERTLRPAKVAVSQPPL